MGDGYSMNKNSKIWYDAKVDVLFIGKEGVEEHFEEVVPGVNVEYDKNKNVIGVEILCASELLSSEIKHIYNKSRVA